MTNLLRRSLEQYTNYRKAIFFKKISNYKNSYAIVGTGLHNLTNLNPCIQYLNVPVTKIFSHQKKNAEVYSRQYLNCTATDNLEIITNDHSIKGVFICVKPELQAGITKKMLSAGKHVFVEKPVGYSLKELEEVYASESNLICHVNLQRRYAKVSEILKKEVKDPHTYNYKFLTGAYIEGDEIFELFIHPIDFLIFLFGPAQLEHLSIKKINNNYHYNLILEHQHVKGSVELSTDFTWQNAFEEIIINTSSKVFNASYPNVVEAVKKPAAAFGIPVEKILKSPLKKITYLNGNSFIPAAELSTHNLKGFYPSVEQFISLAETNKSSFLSSLQSLLPVYKILDKIKSKKESLGVN
jgi:virulence factor